MQIVSIYFIRYIDKILILRDQCIEFDLIIYNIFYTFLYGLYVDSSLVMAEYFTGIVTNIV